MSESDRLERLDDGKLSFDCPGCGMMHAVNVDAPKQPRWGWNGDMVRPTFTPSIRVRWSYKSGRPNKCCHSFVKDGQISFCDDSTHEYAGKTLPLNPIDQEGSAA